MEAAGSIQGAIQGIDHIELYVGNARASAYFYQRALGFRPREYAGLETGLRDRCSYVLQREGLTLVLTSALTPESAVAEHVRIHGEGIKDIALRVADAEAVFERACRAGAQSLCEPRAYEENGGRTVLATIGAFGPTIHTLVQREGETSSTLPGSRPLAESGVPDTGIDGLDHLAVNVPRGELDPLVELYGRALSFEAIFSEETATGQSSMLITVVRHPASGVTFTLVEPGPGSHRSQIEEFLEFHRGAGVQHAALTSADIVSTVDVLVANGVEFLPTPGAYYDELERRVGSLDVDVETLRRRGILADRDEEGYLLQIFTKPLDARPTFYLELIQRHDAIGFGRGNIKALFEAMEREQSRRGNLQRP